MQENVSLVLYVITVMALIISNAVAVTIAIYRRPTVAEVKIMIADEFKEASYLGQRLKTIDEKIDHLYDRLEKFER